MSLYTPKDMTSSPAEYLVDRFTRGISLTYSARVKRIATLQGDVQFLLDHVVNLKGIEDAYLTKMGYGAVSPINRDGTPGINPYSTLPEFGANSRDISMFYTGDKDAIVNSKARSAQGLVSTDQRYAIFKQEALRKLHSEDKFLRNIEHQILSAKLTIERKRLDITSLQDELSAAQGKG